MRKIKKNDFRTDQTIFAFSCPCASCNRDRACDCKQYRYDTANWNVIYGQQMNRGLGGTIRGGGG